MDSIDQIRNNISEVDTLILYASRNTHSIQKYQMFNKIAVVMLCTKFEVFLEDFMDEHSRKVIQGHTNSTMPINLKNTYVDTAVDKTAGTKIRTDKNLFLQSLMTLLKNDGSSIAGIANIRPSTKFSYGKHGQKEIEKLFITHGMEAFIRDSNTQRCMAMMNSLFSIRNNVIHEDASPGLTHQTIIDHRNNIMHFVDLVETDVTTNHNTYYNNLIL